MENDIGIIALFLDRKSADSLHDEVISAGIDGNIVVPQNMHVTLLYLDDDILSYGTDRIVESMAKACERKKVKAKSGSSVKMFDSESSPCYLEVFGDDIFLLRQSIIDELNENGIRYTDALDFIPHITLSYGNRNTNVKIKERDFTFDNIFVVANGKKYELFFIGEYWRRGGKYGIEI